MGQGQLIHSPLPRRTNPGQYAPPGADCDRTVYTMVGAGRCGHLVDTSVFLCSSGPPPTRGAPAQFALQVPTDGG